MLNQLIGQKCLSVSLPVWDAASSEVGAEPLPRGAVAGCPHPLLWVQAALGVQWAQSCCSLPSSAGVGVWFERCYQCWGLSSFGNS